MLGRSVRVAKTDVSDPHNQFDRRPSGLDQKTIAQTAHQTSTDRSPFATKLSTEHESVGTQISREPVGTESLWSRQAEHFTRSRRVNDVQYDDGVQSAYRLNPIVVEDHRNAASAADPARPGLLWRLQRENLVEPGVVRANVAQSIESAAVGVEEHRSVWQDTRTEARLL